MQAAVRHAEPGDAEALDRLVQRAYAYGLRGAYDETTLAAALPHLAQVMPELLACGTFYVAEVDGEMAGCGGWSAWAPGAPAEPTAVAHLRQFATDPVHVRRGVARALLDRSIAEAVDRGVERVEALASRVSVPLYGSAGLEVVRERAIELPGGVRFPVVEMVRWTARRGGPAGP